MFKLFRSRKAQIRGIDFSLSIIIFSLTMGQILLLTNTFIDGNRSQIDFEERLEFVDSLANQLVFNSGYSSFGTGTEDWGPLSTSILNGEQNWNLGLSTAGSIDPYKMGRLSNNSISSLEIDYLTAQTGLNLSKNFRLEILNPIEVEITDSTDDVPNNFIRVDGFVSKSAKPLYGAKIWAFIVDPSGNINQNQTSSDSNGLFSVQVDTIHVSGTYYAIGVIAKYGLNSEDTAIRGHPYLTVEPTRAKISVTNSTSVGTGFKVNVTSEMFASAEPNLIALYPGVSGESNTSIGNLITSGTNLWSNNTISIPVTGSVLFMVFGSNGTLSMGSIDFPVSLDGTISSPVQPTKIPTSDSSSRFLSVSVRGVLVDIIITVWE